MSDSNKMNTRSEFMPKQNVNNHFSILKCKPSASTQIDLVGPTKSAFTKKRPH